MNCTMGLNPLDKSIVPLQPIFKPLEEFCHKKLLQSIKTINFEKQSTFMLKIKNIHLYAISLLFFIFIGYIMYAANVGRELLFFQLIDYIPMGDKLAHVVLIGTLAFLMNLMLGGKTFAVRGVQILLGSCIVFGFITIEEFTQMYIPTRNFDWMDLMANYIGIYMASISTKFQITNSKCI